RSQRLDAAGVGDQVAGLDLRPRPDAHAIRLRDAVLAGEHRGRRLAVRPHALLQRAAQLRAVRLADVLALLVVEGGVEEEAVVLDLKVAVLLADPALAQGHELLALGERAHSHSPFLECDRHNGGNLTRAPSSPLGRATGTGSRSF